MYLSMAFGSRIECHASKNNRFDHWEQRSIILTSSIGLYAMLGQSPGGPLPVLVLYVVCTKSKSFFLKTAVITSIARSQYVTLLYSWRFSRYSAPIHWLVHCHMTSNNETVSRQMP